MRIPDFKKAAENDAAPTAIKPLPILAPVVISSSRNGFLVYRCSYLAFAASVAYVFHPYIIEQPLWALFLSVCYVGLWLDYRRQTSVCKAGVLQFSGTHWLFTNAARTCQLELAGEVLCWSWLIILPLHQSKGGKTRYLLIFNDALSKDDNARLRRWLRACLVPKT